MNYKKKLTSVEGGMNVKLNNNNDSNVMMGKGTTVISMFKRTNVHYLCTVNINLNNERKLAKNARRFPHD